MSIKKFIFKGVKKLKSVLPNSSLSKVTRQSFKRFPTSSKKIFKGAGLKSNIDSRASSQVLRFLSSQFPKLGSGISSLKLGRLKLLSSSKSSRRRLNRIIKFKKDNKVVNKFRQKHALKKIRKSNRVSFNNARRDSRRRKARQIISRFKVR